MLGTQPHLEKLVLRRFLVIGSKVFVEEQMPFLPGAAYLTDMEVDQPPLTSPVPLEESVRRVIIGPICMATISLTHQTVLYLGR